jgi:transcriptional regulator with XRE-family HTH domain
MTIRHVHRKTAPSAAETARLGALRARYQRDRPSPEQLLAEGGHADFVPLGQLLELHQVLFWLKQERQRQRLTLATLAARTGIDQAALSRLESGRNGNPPSDTLYRVAAALGKVISWTFQDAPAEPGSPRVLDAARPKAKARRRKKETPQKKDALGARE